MISVGSQGSKDGDGAATPLEDRRRKPKNVAMAPVSNATITITMRTDVNLHWSACVNTFKSTNL